MASTSEAPAISAKEHISIVFLGHVDAGKSTLSGQVLLLSDMVDKRVLEKYQREAKEKNRESWYLAYILDENEEEREKGKTVEVGKSHFETAKKRYTILDAPGHQKYVPNMIASLSQADVGVLVISARKGEFERGFERDGQTREHAMLAKTLGVNNLVILINKMDEPTVAWSKERYDEIVGKLTPWLKQIGYVPKKNCDFYPVSGMSGTNMKDRLTSDVCPWYSGPSFFEALDAIPPFARNVDGPVRLPIIGRYSDRGQVNILGKLESGKIHVGQKLLMMPNGARVEVLSVSIDDTPTTEALPGENIEISVKGVDEEAVHAGFVLCSPESPVNFVKAFLGQFIVLNKNIFSEGYSPVLHIHTAVEECTITRLVATVDKRTGEKSAKPPKYVKAGDVVQAIIEVNQPICIERFEQFPQLGRFTLREDKTIGIGKVLALKMEKPKN